MNKQALSEGYKANLISTIVDYRSQNTPLLLGYKANLISTIVDILHQLCLLVWAIKPI